MQKILLTDNYDSFIFNIAQILEESGEAFEIFKNDEIPFARLNEFSEIVISPGPGTPDEAGDLLKLIAAAQNTHPILGICLGHQALARHFGARLKNVLPRHGLVSKINFCGAPHPMFKNVPNGFEACRYHSWAVDAEGLPTALRVCANSEDGAIMALCHETLKIASVQFHPESALTPQGRRIIGNWLKDARGA